MLPRRAVGAVAMRCLISDAIVMNACSTFVADLADVSRNGIERPSARLLADSVSTCFLETRSDLLPTSSLFTPSEAYLSISCSHCFTLLNDSLSVTSYTTMMPCAPR